MCVPCITNIVGRLPDGRIAQDACLLSAARLIDLDQAILG